MKEAIILALAVGSLSVTNLAYAVDSKLMNQNDNTFVAAVEHDGNVEQIQDSSEQNVFDNYLIPVNRWSSKRRHHNSKRHHRNSIRFRSDHSRHYGKRFRYSYGYSGKRGSFFGHHRGYSPKRGKFSRYGKRYSHSYGGHSRFKNGGFIRHHRNH